MNKVMGENQSSDSELLELLRQGDEESFRELYSSYRARLYSFLLRLSGRPALAEELCQEVWLRMITHPPAAQTGLPLGPWLFRVASNLYYSYLRSRENDANRIAELTVIQYQSSSQPGPWEELAGNEVQHSFLAALPRLPLPYRECLLLVVGTGLTPHQAAEVLDLPASTFRKRLSRAREMVAKLMTFPLKLEKEVK